MQGFVIDKEYSDADNVVLVAKNQNDMFVKCSLLVDKSHQAEIAFTFGDEVDVQHRSVEPISLGKWKSEMQLQWHIDDNIAHIKLEGGDYPLYLMLILCENRIKIMSSYSAIKILN